MKKRQRTTTKVGLILLLFAGFAISFLPLQAWGALDTDGDGFLDTDEMAQQQITGDETYFVDLVPNIPDLVVILEKLPGSVVPYNPFEIITNKFTNLNLHVIEVDNFRDLNGRPYDLKITETQNAVLLTLNPNPLDGDLGSSVIGYPAMGKVTGNVFTKRIADDVEIACGSMGCIALNSIDSSIAITKAYSKPEVIDYFTKNVIAHETFHMLYRVFPVDRKLDYHHPQLGYVLDHHAFYKVYSKENLVRWFISDAWMDDSDVPRFK